MSADVLKAATRMPIWEVIPQGSLLIDTRSNTNETMYLGLETGTQYESAIKEQVTTFLEANDCTRNMIAKGGRT